MQTAAVERFECDQCGACCPQLLIQADWLDVQREPRLTQADRHYASLPILDALEMLQDEYRAVLLNGEKGFHFLCENKCSICPTRPNDCVGMQPGDEQCQSSRTAENLPPLEPIA